MAEQFSRETSPCNRAYGLTGASGTLYFAAMKKAVTGLCAKNSVLYAAIEQRAGRCIMQLAARVLILTAIFVLSFCSKSLAQEVHSAAADEQIFQKAMAAMNEGNAAAAIPLLKELHSRYQDNFEINESLGLAYAAENDLHEALSLMAAAAAERPGSDAAATNLGIAYLKVARNVDAAHELERAASLNPANTAAQEALGQALMQLHQPVRAAAAFHKALVADSNNPTLLYNTALADFDAGNAASAAQLLARLPGVESSPEAQSLYADVEEKLGNYKESGQHYINAARLAPTEINEYVLGVEFLRHWTFPAAIAEFEAASQRFPESRRLRMGLGIAYFGNHNFDDALAVFAKLFADDPDNAIYADLLGRTCAVPAEGNNPRCAALIAFAQAHPGEGKIATYAAINILHQTMNPTQDSSAEQLLHEAIHAVPDFPDAHYEMGLLLEQNNKWRESIPELLTATRLKMDYSAAHYRLAIAYWHTGLHDKAQEEIQLWQKYSAEEAREKDARLEQIQTLLVTRH